MSGNTVTPSSGNVFADIGLPNATELLAQAEARHAAETEADYLPLLIIGICFIAFTAISIAALHFFNTWECIAASIAYALFTLVLLRVNYNLTECDGEMGE